MKKFLTLYWTGVFCLLLSISSTILSSCQHKITEDKYAINIDMKIVSINYETELSNDKFHKPQACNLILFETIGEGKKLYREINTCNLPCSCGGGGIHIDNVWIYNHRVGDTVHFDYLLKSKFFEINERADN